MGGRVLLRYFFFQPGTWRKRLVPVEAATVSWDDVEAMRGEINPLEVGRSDEVLERGGLKARRQERWYR
jgi:hypothetical protein